MDRRTACQGEPLARRLESGLTPQAWAWVGQVAELGRARGERVYLVGGLVRDLLLGLPHRDLDLTLERGGGAFAEALAAEAGGTVLHHPEFGTAVYTSPDGFEIDLVTARRESYRAPATLPVVEPGDLASDLLRRDFAANALALRIAPEPEVELIDLCDGIADLERRSLRVLHPCSFVDDPTRILRGVRLEARLGFRFDPETERLARSAAMEGVFPLLSGSRLRHELVLLLEEPGSAIPALGRLAELGVLQALLPEGAPHLDWNAELEKDLLRTEAALERPFAHSLADTGLRRWRLLWMALTRSLGRDAEVDPVQARLLLEGGDAKVLIGFAGRLARTRESLGSGRPPAPHQVAEALAPLSGEELVLLHLDPDAEVRRAVELYATSLRGLQIGLRGADLRAHGIPPGPALGAALRAVRRARWDGEIGRDEELDYALAQLGAQAVIEARGGTGS
jgi:tRNA nucleotidyltransferase (CCA-adding enzyme)